MSCPTLPEKAAIGRRRGVQAGNAAERGLPAWPEPQRAAARAGYGLAGPRQDVKGVFELAVAAGRLKVSACTGCLSGSPVTCRWLALLGVRRRGVAVHGGRAGVPLSGLDCCP